MTKILVDATATGGVALGADDIKHLTGGTGASDGVAILSDEDAVYIPNSKPDFEATLELAKDTLNTVKTLIEDINSLIDKLNAFPIAVDGMGAPVVFTAWTNTLTPITSDADTVISEIDTAKEDLK